MNVLALVAAAAALASPAPREPQDTRPVLSADGGYVAFARTLPAREGGGVATYVQPTGHGPARRLARGVPRAWHGRELLVDEGAASALVALDGTLVAAIPGSEPTLSQDNLHVAYLRGGTLYVEELGNPASERLAARGIVPPSWDEAGPVFAYDTILASTVVPGGGSSIELVDVSNGTTRTVFTGPNQNVNPVFVGDGVAWESNAGPYWRVWTSALDGSPPHTIDDGAWNDRFPQQAPGRVGLMFISDRLHERGGATRYRYDLFLRDRVTIFRIAGDVNPISPVAAAETSSVYAYSAGRECNRWGIYAEATGGFAEHRLSNRCVFRGTASNDVLRGTAYPDFFYGLGGNDVIHARDGVRDVVSCGPGLDTAFVDRIDVVRGCERVARS